jgi:hypothetical protein
MQEFDLLSSLNVNPNYTPVIEPILARGQEAPVPIATTQPTQVQAAAFTEVVPTQPVVSVPAVSTNGSLPRQEQKFSDYASYGYLSPNFKDECCAKIPDYRLATSCSNCAFSTYEPVSEQAICKKWNHRVIPFYYCDSHVDPASLLNSSNSEEMFSEPVQPQPVLATEVQSLPAPVSTNLDFPDQELYEEAKKTAPSFVDQAGVKDEALSYIYLKRKYEQLVNQKSSKLV